jgi:hypothetical protein
VAAGVLMMKMGFFSRFRETLLNEETEILGDTGQSFVSLTDFNCRGCGAHVDYAIRYLLCTKCVQFGLPSKSVHKTSKDSLEW